MEIDKLIAPATVVAKSVNPPKVPLLDLADQELVAAISRGREYRVLFDGAGMPCRVMCRVSTTLGMNHWRTTWDGVGRASVTATVAIKAALRSRPAVPPGG